MLILVQPARLDRYFRAMGGTPAQKLELPDDALTHFNLLDAQVWLPSRL
jgi:hypothetical protein